MRVVTLQMDAVKVKLRLWDSSGQRSFDSITKSYLRSAHGIVVVYDVTSRRSFERAMEWIRFVEDSGSYARANGTLLLVGNKVDCVGTCVVCGDREGLQACVCCTWPTDCGDYACVGNRGRDRSWHPRKASKRCCCRPPHPVCNPPPLCLPPAVETLTPPPLLPSSTPQLL